MAVPNKRWTRDEEQEVWDRLSPLNAVNRALEYQRIATDFNVSVNAVKAKWYELHKYRAEEFGEVDSELGETTGEG